MSEVNFQLANLLLFLNCTSFLSVGGKCVPRGERLARKKGPLSLFLVDHRTKNWDYLTGETATWDR